MNPLSRRQTILDLKERLTQFERDGQPNRDDAFTTGTPFDALLPENGITWGTVIEFLSEEGAGAAALALRIAARVLPLGGAFVIVDERGEFYPPAAAGLGIPLEQTVLVRPAHSLAALWALEQALRSRAAAVVLGWAGTLNDRAYRRLKLATEAGGCLGFLLRPVTCCTEPSWADVRLRVDARPAPPQANGRRLQVEVLQIRGGASRPAVELELNDETNDVHLVPRLAHSAPPRRRSAG